jgi:NAD(P)-dependent dehydrogenase (short-subunit alcohol dehydrogenase family)
MFKTAKKVLITGTSYGLGLSLSNVFLQNGWNVYASVLGEEEREGVTTFYMDVSDTASVRAAAEQIGKLTDSLDIIINNASVLCSESKNGLDNTIFDELDIDAMLQTYNVNALGALRVAHAFMPLLIKGKERLLINISSEAGSISQCRRDKWFGYSMSKAGMNLCGTLVYNGVKQRGGRVWQIHPGYIKASMHTPDTDKGMHTPNFSAQNIYSLIENDSLYNSEGALYMDIFGNKLEW